MGKLSPPSIPEWHSSVIGFYYGVSYGLSNEDIVIRSMVDVVRTDNPEGHIGDTRQELAYAGALFIVGYTIGRQYNRPD